MKQLKKSILLTGSILFLLLLPKKIVNACGFYVSPGEYRFWLLQPDLTNQPDLTPFFFASTYIYKGNQYVFSDSYVQQNIGEWYRFIHKAASVADIDSLLNQTDPQLFFENHKIIARHNSFLRYLLRPANREQYEYLLLSKKVEQVAADADPWQENRFPVAAINKIIQEGRALQQKAKLPFIRFRTAYQLIRLYNYNHQPVQVINVYDSCIAPVSTDSWVKTAALFQKALNASPAEYDYLLSKVFDRGGYNRVSCLVNFRSSQLAGTLGYAKNAHERTVLYTMQVMNHPGRSLDYIKKIYRMEPAYKEIPFLLLREINKVEDWLVTGKVTPFDPAVPDGGYENYNKVINYRADQAYAKQLSEWLLLIIQEKKNRDTALLQLFAAHLSLLQGNYPMARRHLTAVKTAKQLPANVRSQLLISEFLLDLQTEKGFDRAAENRLMAILHTSAKQSGIYDNDIMKDQLVLFTARKLIQKGIRAKGFMLLSHTRRALGDLPIENYKNIYQVLEEEALPEDYDGIVQMLDKNEQEKTDFEKFITRKTFGSAAGYYYNFYETDSIPEWNRNKVLDCKASWYIRNNKLKAALQTLQQIPDRFWTQEPYATYIKGDPFFLNVYNAHQVRKEDKRNYNKRQILENMIRLQQVAKQNSKQSAEADFLLANAWYNISYYGKDWLVLKQWWSSNEVAYYNPAIKRTSFNDVYLGCTRARELYLKAMKETSDKKLALLCCFMAGKCYDNFSDYLWCIKNKGNYKALQYKTSPNPYLAELKQKGISDNYYHELVRECAVYNDYIKQYNR